MLQCYFFCSQFGVCIFFNDSDGDRDFSVPRSRIKPKGGSSSPARGKRAGDGKDKDEALRKGDEITLNFKVGFCFVLFCVVFLFISPLC